MNEFMLGGFFNNIINSFGRPRVNNWMVLYAEVNKTSEQQYVLVQKVPIPNFSNFKSMYGNEKENYSSWLSDTATKAYITAYNPQTWELCHFHMSTDLNMLQRIAKGSLIYDVYHIS